MTLDCITFQVLKIYFKHCLTRQSYKDASYKVGCLGVVQLASLGVQILGITRMVPLRGDLKSFLFTESSFGVKKRTQTYQEKSHTVGLLSIQIDNYEKVTALGLGPHINYYSLVTPNVSNKVESIFACNFNWKKK